MIDHFLLNRCQKKRKGWGVKLLKYFSQKYLAVHELQAVKIRSLHTYVIHRMVYFERYCMRKSSNYLRSTLNLAIYECIIYQKMIKHFDTYV